VLEGKLHGLLERHCRHELRQWIAESLASVTTLHCIGDARLSHLSRASPPPANSRFFLDKLKIGKTRLDIEWQKPTDLRVQGTGHLLEILRWQL
jgi:hypothetical protein